MTDILSQEEIDALLSAGIGGLSEMEEETPPKPAKPAPKPAAAKSAAYQGSSSSFSPGYQFESFSSPASATATEEFSQKKKTSLKPSARIDNPVNVQPAVFTSFDEEELPADTTNLEIILNLNLEIRVQLGKTTQSVKQVLELGSGSVLELDRLNGEPVDLLVNKKYFAKGEMIVIGENFGVRVTDILSIHEIIEALR